jgi:biotin carboxyl carrier protein
MSEDPAQAIARAAAELVPPLTERLNRLGLGEIEVRQGDLRVRVVAVAKSPSGSGGGVDVTVTRLGATDPASATERSLDQLKSPAVGHFVYADGLGPGLAVASGTEVGFVEMLGIRHEVRTVSAGVVRHLVAESGEPVEYGQLLVELERGSGSGSSGGSGA